MTDAASRLEGLADALATAGAVVAGGAAFGATIAFIGASALRDLGYPSDPLRAAEYGAQLGGVFGLAAILSATLG